MKIEVAERMAHLPKQFFASLVARVNARVQQGHDVINLGQGNPDLPTPEHIVESLREAALDPITHKYPPFSGLPAFKQAAADYYRREYGVHIDAQTEVAVLFGGKTGLVEISELFLNPGDVALVPDPGYPDYWSGVALAGGRMIKVPLLEVNDFLPDLGAISPNDREQAKLMFLNYPNNPTGAAATPQFFAELAQFGRNHDIVIVHDFAYGAIGFDGIKPPSFMQAPGAKDVGIEIYTLSKTYNMAGWRIAFAVGNRDVIQAINLIQDHYYVSLFAAVQIAGATALQSSQDCVQDLVATYEARRNAFVEGLQNAGYPCQAPKGSFFTWLKVPAGFSSEQFADFLLEKANVAVAPGIGFGDSGEGYVRVGLLTSEDRLREAASRIVRALQDVSK